MFLLSFLLFSSIYIDGENYIKIYRSSHEIDLFFVDEGFFNPAGGLGIIGAELNPASLGRVPDVQFMTAFSLSGVSSSDIDSFSFDIEEDGEDITNTAFLDPGSRLYGQYNALGGFNFIGFAKRFGMVSLGISYGSGYKLGFEASLSGDIHGDFRADEAFEFTHDEFSEIPEGDTVSVNPLFKGAVAFDNPVPLRVEYSDLPIFLGTGINIGPLAFGVGFKFQKCRLSAEGGFSTHIDSFVVEVRDTTVIDADGDEWIIDDFSAALDFDENLAEGTITSSGFSATHPVFTLGTLLDGEGLKLSFGFDIGSQYELEGDYGWDFSAISELPDSFVSIDSTGLIIEEDSLISGRAVIVIDSMIRERGSEFGNESLKFAGSSFNFGFIIEPMNLGVNGKLAFRSDYSFSKIGLYTYTALPFPVIDARLGLAADVLILSGYELEEIDWRLIPSATIGLSLSYQRDYLNFYMPVKYDVSHIALNILNSQLGDEDDSDMDLSLTGGSNIWDNLAFGFGFSVKM
jgi:hypothetical protein